MTTTVNLRKILHRKLPEMVAPAPVATIVGACVISSTLATQLQMFVQATAAQYLYRPDEDAWLLLPSGVLGAIAAGTCGVHHPNGPSGTALAGSTATTLNTGLNLPGDLAGNSYKVRLTGGVGAGQERTITSNTQGANAVLTVDAAWTTTPDVTTTYLLLTGRFYVMATTAAAWTFKYYDVATNTWSAALNVTGPPGAWTIDGRLIATAGVVFASGTATAGAASTLTNTAKNWAVNQWANYQVRITVGTGAGQLRTVASNTATVLTTSAAWTTIPDATSVYALEGNEDFLYLMGNAAVTLYRYSISGNAWTTLTPGAARAAAPGAGLSGHWVPATTDPTWTAENTIINGKRIYSFRGGASNVLDYYDIAANTWVSGVVYQRQTETWTTGTSWALVGNFLYSQKDATGRLFRYNIPAGTLDPWMTMLTGAQGAATVGDKMFDVSYTDGATTIRWVYLLYNTSTLMYRVMVV